MTPRCLPLLLGLAVASAGAIEPAVIPSFSKVQSDYLLACGGCHGEGGVSNSRFVPDLAGQVGYFLKTQEGREYLVRLPNVSAAALDDTALADVLNFMVRTIGRDSAPADAAPYTASEVLTLRQRPLNTVQLSVFRAQLVSRLVADYGVPASIGHYGESVFRQREIREEK